MKLLKSVYTDNQGNVWEIQKQSLPKKKGQYNYWIAECHTKNLAYTEKLKRDIIKILKSINI